MSAGGLKTISESPVDSLRDSDQFSIKLSLNSGSKRVRGGKFYQPKQMKSHSVCASLYFYIQGDALIEESESEEAAGTTESVGGFFIKHGTFMGTENELTISQNSDVAASTSDSDYDTDLDTEGKLAVKFRIFFEMVQTFGWDLSL